MMDAVLASSVDYSLDDGRGLFELASKLASSLEEDGVDDVAALREEWAQDTVHTYSFLLGLDENHCHGADLKIYVYDVPENLTRHPLDCVLGQWGTEVLFHQYFLSSACRTLDPEKAELFYVPIYGTCLFTKDALDNDADASERIWDPLIRHIFAQPWAQRNKLMDHIFLFADGQSARIWDSYDLVRSEAVFLMVESKCPTWDEPMRRYSDIKPCSSGWKDIIIPGHTDHARLQAMRRYNRPTAQRELIMTFHGSHSGNKEVYDQCAVRDKVMELAQFAGVDVGGFVPNYLEIKGNAHFCLIPAGTSPWTNQLYESIQCGCIPVILSDEYEVAFQHLVDWRRISIKWPEALVGKELYEFLASFSLETIAAMKADVDDHSCWFDYFSTEPDCSPYAAVLAALVDRRERRLQVYRHWERFWNVPKSADGQRGHTTRRTTRFHTLANETFLMIAQVHHGAPITMSPALSGPAQVCTAVTQGEIERLNEEISGLREKLERFQAALAGERSSVQQIEELDSHLRFASAEVQRLQSELETVKKQERALQKSKAKESAELGKVLQEKQKMQEILRGRLQHREAIPSAVVLAEELEHARRDAEAKELQIQDLQLVGTRMGSQLIEASEKQRQAELMLRRVPQMESENQQLRGDLSTKVSELDEVNEKLSKLEDQLRRREEAAPELTAAELLATEAERLEEVSKKRKFVADGVFNAELNEFLARTLGEDGYAGVEVRVTPIRTEIIIRATRTREVLGEKGRRIRELTALVQKRFGFPENSVELFAERVENRASCAMAQCESLRFKLIGGLAVRRACYGVLRFIMENGAKGVEVIISGKLRAQRAKAMKFRQGYLISTGEPKRHYISEAVRHVQMRQGTIGIKVKIMMSHDPEGKMGPKMQLPDNVIVHEPKDETPMMMPPQEEQYGGYDNQGGDGVASMECSLGVWNYGSRFIFQILRFVLIDLTHAGARPEDAPRLVIAALQKLQTAVSKREEELKTANEKIAELCKYGAKRDEDVQREAYDALRVELLDVSKRCADAEAKLRELGVEETKGADTSLITKMSMLIYQLQVSVISGTGLRTKGWRPGPESEALSCIVEVVGKEAKFGTKPVRDSKNPAWNHTGELQMSHSDSLRFMVQGTQQRTLGKADLQATRLIGQGFEGELALEERPKELLETETESFLKVKVSVLNSFLATASDLPSSNPAPTTGTGSK
ncbi:RPS3A, partial [Symbiodinium microadriaticum]